MKMLILSPIAALFSFAPLSLAAPKAIFSVFGTAPAQFAEATCTGLPAAPRGTTLRVPATDARGVSFEADADLPSQYKLVISANADPAERTLFLSVARVDTTAITASTKGIDAGLRTGSSIDVYCELNAGAQITKSP